MGCPPAHPAERIEQAGCAFEAYNDIEAGAPSLKMTSMGGTEITYVDK